MDERIKDIRFKPGDLSAWKQLLTDRNGDIRLQVDIGGEASDEILVDLDTVIALLNGESVVSISDSNLDAFNNLRVSVTNQRFDVEFKYDLQPLLFDVIQGSSNNGTIVHDVDSRTVIMTTNSALANSGYLLRQRNHNPYTPGNSQKIDITGTLDGSNIGGGTTSVFLRSNGVDTVFNQIDWINSTLADDVDWSTSQIFQIDFQSLKIGRLRFALVRKGRGVLIHEIYNDNIRKFGFWQYPEQPLTWNIYTTATETITEIGYFDNDNGLGFRHTLPNVESTASIVAICGTVKSENGGELLDIAGFPFCVDLGVGFADVGNVLIPILSIKLNSTFKSIINTAIAKITAISISTNNPIRYVLTVGGTLTGASWSLEGDNAIDAEGNSAMLYDINATAITGGTKIDSDNIGGGKNAIINSKNILGKNILSVPPIGDKILTISCVRTGTSNGEVRPTIKWEEIR